MREMRVRIVATGRRPWRRVEFDGGVAHVVGDPNLIDKLVVNLAHAKDDHARISLLNDANFLFAAIIETAGQAIAVCDVVRSTPIFFARTASGWALGNDARALAQSLASDTLDRDSLLEIEMAGYSTGGNTAFADLRVLDCGTYLILANTDAPVALRYFRFLPTQRAEQDGAIERLGTALDAAIGDLVARARGRRVFVAISGGLDSRLVLAKLVEHACPNLACFSYGAPGNTDARAGREVAARLGVPWQFMASRRAAHREFFRGENARNFWRFADGLACVPSPQDIVPLYAQKANGGIDSSSIIVNGQTGDFLSGGHIPDVYRTAGETSRSAFLANIVDKHYSLWRRLVTPGHRRAIEQRIEHVTGPLPAKISHSDAIARYELWEYEARQAAWVVNGQRTYEFLSFDWELPLWDPRLIRFFRDASLEDKLGQRVYRAYLANWNYRDLFANFARARSSWQGWAKPLAVVEKGARILGGPVLQRRANATLRYFGHYRHQYAELGFTKFMAVRNDMRHILGHQARSWLTWNGFPLADETG